MVAHWNDDWYAPERVSRQAGPILQGVAEITALNDVMFMLISARPFWTVTPKLFQSMFVGNASGITLIYRRDIWRRSGPFPAIQLREDCDFMVKAMRDGARLCPLPGRGLVIHVATAITPGSSPKDASLSRTTGRAGVGLPGAARRAPTNLKVLWSAASCRPSTGTTSSVMRSSCSWRRTTRVAS